MNFIISSKQWRALTFFPKGFRPNKYIFSISAYCVYHFIRINIIVDFFKKIYRELFGFYLITGFWIQHQSVGFYFFTFSSSFCFNPFQIICIHTYLSVVTYLPIHMNLQILFYYIGST